MGIIKGFTFDGVNSLDYNVGITGSAVYNAPTRDVEMISIPGRDGEYALDHGKFNNIEVTYPAGAFDTTQPNFATKMSDLRNQLASRVGYKRLEDEYNPDEYRMAIYKSGLDVSPVHYSQAGQFDIIFDCKPQRWLKSGETATSVANNGTITNPTLFDAKPLLSFKATGSGTISLGSQSISLLNNPIGVTDVAFHTSHPTVTGQDLTTRLVLEKNYETGDPITISGISGGSFGVSAIIGLRASSDITSFSYSSGQDLGYTPTGSSISGKQAKIQVYLVNSVTFTAGTSSTVTKTGQVQYLIGGTQYTQTITLKLVYQPLLETIDARWKTTVSSMTYQSTTDTSNYRVTVDSSSYALTGDLYIDLDIGEAYRVSNGVTTSINNFVNLGGELPVLPSGSTTVTYDNTINTFKITPRWWKI